MTGRDHETKEALIKYLQKDTDERFWQAINNFAETRGLCAHFLITAPELPKSNFDYKDLFFQESDNLLD